MNNSRHHRNAKLDLLRGLAILGVVAVHCNHFLKSLSSSEIKYLNNGKYGVEVFFFLSGFLIASLYGNFSEKIDLEYFKKRFARIFPLWSLFLIFNLGFNIIQSRLGMASIFSVGNYPILTIAQSIILGLTFTLFLSSNLWNSLIPGGWSIQAEVWHYLIYPIVNRIGLTISGICLIVINFLSAFINNSVKYNNSDYRYANSSFFVGAWMRLGLYSTFSFFFLGVISVYLTRQLNGKNFAKEKKQVQFIQLLVFFVFILSMILSPCPYGNTFSAVIYLILNLLMMSILIKFTYIKRLMLALGKYSYFIYFFHFIILKCLRLLFQFIYPFGNRYSLFLLIYLTTVLLSLLFAIPSMKYIEKPVINAFR